MWKFMTLLAVFLFLSLLDLGLTLSLMERYGNIEGNPAAAFIYENGGKALLTAFKAFLALLVAGIATYIFAKKRFGYCGVVLVSGCLAVGITVGYSLTIVAECAENDRSIEHHQLQPQPPPPGRNADFLGSGGGKKG